MAFDQGLAERIRDILEDRRASFREIRMFGGLAFMVRGHMTVGVMKSDLLVRIDPDRQPETLKEPQVRKMEFTGRPMKGIVLVSVEGTDREEDLERWIDHALAFTRSLPAKEEAPAPLRRKK